MSEQGMPEVNGPKPRLLFVEDEATLREHLAERLSDEYVVDTAGNGNDALLAVMRAKPAIVVTDIVMPDMDGVELLKTLRQSPGTRGIPVLLISGRAPEAQRIEGFEKGADGFLAKPYTERELRALIGSMVRSAQLRTEAASFRDIGERKQIKGDLQHALVELHAREEQLRENQRRLAAEMDSTRRLHELVSRLLECNDLQTSLEEVLDAAIALLDADMGNVQLFDPRTRKSQIVAHRGFREDFLEHFRGVGADPSAVCAHAAHQGQSAIVEDVQTDPGFAPHRAIAASAGFRAVQSTPITSRKGELLGVLSTYFRKPHRPSERALRMVDLYCKLLPMGGTSIAAATPVCSSDERATTHR
jgi:DNA-binding response OmpR family regulator